MAKKLFVPEGTIVTTAFLNSIYGQGTGGGHRHDGVDADGHCGRIGIDEIDMDVKSGMSMLGEVKMYAGADVPECWLLCDGSAVPAGSEYAPFRAWIDIRAPYLRVNGAYKTPDLRGRVPLCAAMTAFELGETGGEIKHALTEEEMPKHWHGLNSDGAGGGGTHSGILNNNLPTPDRATASRGGNSSLNEGESVPHNNMQPYFALNFIIKAA